MCPTCQGSGTRTSQSGGFSYSEPCDCRGRGLSIEHPCPVCDGTGRTATRTMQVRIPAGVTAAQRIRVRARAVRASTGAGRRSLRRRPVPLIRSSELGDHLTLTVPVPFPEAALCAEIVVPTLDGPAVRVRIPAGTPNGRTLRVRDRGVRKPGATGDLLVTVDVQVPRALSDEARSALQAYAAVAPGGNPRASLLAGG
jgi:molecular chaperone DnaJ